MTDGIIQEVFKNLLRYDYNSFLRVDIELLQQELIEKIKQADFSCDTAWGITGIEIKRKLIGDNNE